MSRLDELKENSQLVRLKLQMAWIGFYTVTSGSLALFISGKFLELILAGIVLDIILIGIIIFLTFLALLISREMRDYDNKL